MLLLFAILVFLTISMIGVGVYVLASAPKESDIIRNRLEAIEKGSALSKTTLDLNLIRDELLSSIPALNRMLARWSWPARLRTFISQAGLEMRAGKLVLLCGALGVAVLEVAELIYGVFWLSLTLGFIAALLPLIVVVIRRARRLAAFERQFPEVIDLLSRSVRAGHSFTAGLEIVSSDLGEPVCGEFRITFDEQRFGLPVRDALLNLCERVPLIDVRLFVIALLVQKETGGNLAEILDNLAHVIRERFRIAGEVRVRTAQGRLTALLLIALPIVMMIFLHFMDPDYVKVLFVDRLGQFMLIAAAGLQILGGIVIWRIIKIKV